MINLSLSDSEPPLSAWHCLHPIQLLQRCEAPIFERVHHVVDGVASVQRTFVAEEAGIWNMTTNSSALFFFLPLCLVSIIGVLVRAGECTRWVWV